MVTKDEQLISVIGHMGVFFFPVVLPAALWIFKKDQSPFIGFQAKQAFIWQLVWFAINGVVLGFLSIISVALGFATFGIGLFVAVPAMMVLAFVIWAVQVGFALYAAWQVFHGVNYYYPVIGDFAAKH